MKKLRIGCFGDDFTGSSDAASFLQKGGLNTIMLTKLPDIHFVMPVDTEAVVVALKTRTIPANEAVKISKEVYDWFIEKNVEHIYFKYCSTFDSTSQGNIGPVTDMLLETSGQTYTILCPALPVNHRTVENGILYVNGTRLENSHMRNHPLTPMKESSLKKLMESQGKYQAFNLYREDFNSPKKDLYERLSTLEKKCDHFYLIPDFTNDQDGQNIADVFQNLKVLTGGSGLLEYLGKIYNNNDVKKLNTRAVYTSGKGILLAGSCSKVTLSQIETYEKLGGRSIALDVSMILSDQEGYSKSLRTLLDEQPTELLIYSSQESEKVLALQEKFGKEVLSIAIEEFTAEIARYAYETGYKRFIIAGGETSGAVTKKLDFEAFHILEDVEPGVPVMAPISNDKVRIVLKSGSFGSNEFFLHAIEKITNKVV